MCSQQQAQAGLLGVGELFQLPTNRAKKALHEAARMRQQSKKAACIGWRAGPSRRSDENELGALGTRSK